MSKPWVIVVADRGFIFVGHPHRDGAYIIIEDAFNVRRFSLNTKDGLGGLAMRGPQADNDILDPMTVVKIPVIGEIVSIACPSQDAWDRWFVSLSTPPKKAKR